MLQRKPFRELEHWSIWGMNVKDLKWECVFTNQDKEQVLNLFRNEFWRTRGDMKKWAKFILVKDETKSIPQEEIRIDVIEATQGLPDDFMIDKDKIQEVKSAYKEETEDRKIRIFCV